MIALETENNIRLFPACIMTHGFQKHPGAGLLSDNVGWRPILAPARCEMIGGYPPTKDERRAEIAREQAAIKAAPRLENQE